MARLKPCPTQSHLMKTPLAAFWRWAHFTQSLSRLRGFIRARIALDDALQFLRAFVFFSQFEQRISLLELRGGSLVAAGEILQNQIIVRDRFLVIAGFELNFREIEI